MSKMLCDSNSVSLMSIDNSSSSIVSEPIKKFSPSKFAAKSWWEEVEASEQTVFRQEDAVNEVIQQPIKCTETADTETKSVTTMDPEMLTFSNKIKVNEENNDVVDKDGSDYQFLDRTNESNESIASNSREITLEFLDSSNGQKYDRLVREVKIKTPFKRRLSGDSRSNSPISFFPSENEHENVNDDTVGASTTTSTAIDNNCEEGATTSHTSVFTGRSHGKRRRCNQEIETCAEVLARRQKQIDYGKNTMGYDNYIKQIPRNKRQKDHPWTPPKQFKYSRRAFDGLIKGWRTKLHCFDPPSNKGTKENYNADIGSSESDEEDDLN